MEDGQHRGGLANLSPGALKIPSDGLARDVSDKVDLFPPRREALAQDALIFWG